MIISIITYINNLPTIVSHYTLGRGIPKMTARKTTLDYVEMEIPTHSLQ